MNRTIFILITAIILMGAFILGWFTHWLITRFARLKGSNMDEVDRLAQMLHEAEETRDQAIVYIEQREHELISHISQKEAELRAAMEGLRETHHEVAELRHYIERTKT